MSNFIIPEPAKEKAIVSGRLIQRKAISKSDERTFLLTIEFDHDVPYQTGDSIAIYPDNKDEDVLEFLKALSLDQETLIEDQVTAFTYLKKKVCLTKWTSKLSKLLFNESTLPESLKDSKPCDILKNIDLSEELAKEIVTILPPQLPRYYSIACSPKVNPRSIDLIVSLNSFVVDGVVIWGLASSYLCKDLDLGEFVHGFIHSANHFRVPSENIPIIMIGPGTGIAPFRGFIQERLECNHDKNWLFFGERHRSSDFYFEDELLSYHNDQKLKLSLAFSRDQEHKIYVQHLIKEHKQEFADWLKQGAFIYVCGDAKNMARDVEQAIIEILAEIENIELKSAQTLLRGWRKERRYNLDVY